MRYDLNFIKTEQMKKQLEGFLLRLADKKSGTAVIAFFIPNNLLQFPNFYTECILLLVSKSNITSLFKKTNRFTLSTGVW